MPIAVLEHFRGRGPLWRVFWLFGVIPSNLLLGIILMLLARQASPGLISLFLLLLLGFTFWIVVSVWRCADNVRNPTLGIIARWLTVAWAVNTVLFALAIQVQLLA